MDPAYAAWAASRGIRVHAHLAVAHRAQLGHHVLATRAVAAGELLVAVPAASALDLSPDAPAVAPLRAAGAPPLCASSVLLADALAQGAAGPLGLHAAILERLPPVGNLVEWRAGVGQLHEQLLRGTSLAATLHTMPLLARFRQLVLPALRAQGAGGGSGAAPAAALPGLRARFAGELEGWAAGRAAPDAPTTPADAPPSPLEAALLRAATLIMSRCFHDAGAGGGGGGSAAPPPPPVLLPLADFLNHHPTAAVTSNARVGDEFHFYALRPLRAGEQVFLSYGPLSDAQLAHTYGFVPEDDDAHNGGGGGAAAAAVLPRPWNPHNSVTLPARVLVTTLRALVAGGGRARAAAQFDRAIAALRTTGLLPPATPSSGGGGGGAGGDDATGAAGFTLALNDAAIDEGLWDALQQPAGGGGGGGGWRARGRALEALVPPALLTAVQLAVCGDDATVREYVAACKRGGGGGGGAPVMLRVPAPSSLLAALGLAPRGDECAAGTAGSSLGAPVGPGGAGTAAGSADATNGGGGDDNDDDDDADPDDVLETWSHTLTLLAAALRGYPSSLKADLAWYASVSAAAVAGGGGDAGAPGGSSSEPPSKRARTGGRAPTTTTSTTTDGGSGANDDSDDPWSWSLPRQVAAGVADGAYRACRLVALREKQLLAAAIAAIDAELRMASEAMSAGSAGGEESGESD
jgi:hypothetical protein